MKNFLTAFVLFLIFSVLGIWYYSCKIKAVCNNYSVNVATKKTELTKPTFNILLPNGTVLFHFLEEFKINNADATVQIPNELVSFKDSIFSFFNKNQKKELLISGYYNINETDTLGINRAEYIKKMLVNFGVNENKVSTKALKKKFEYEVDGYYYGGILMVINPITIAQEKQIERSIENKILYASFGSSTFIPDNTLKAYAAELKVYLEKYPKKQVKVIGHTDNKGNEESNNLLGKKRAFQVIKYLTETGIDNSKIIGLSKGETDPIEDNGTENGRAKNRRIEIIVN